MCVALLFLASTVAIAFMAAPSDASPGQANNLLNEENKACTCFIAAGTGSATGEVIASKNRDLQQVQVMKFVDPDERYSYIGSMTNKAPGISQGLNEMGLSIGHTWMPVSGYDYDGYSPFMVNQLVMEMCANVAEAIELIDNLPKREGATYMVADNEMAAFVETVPTIYSPDIAVEIVQDGVSYHTNHYLYEPFYSWVIEDGFSYMWTPSYSRYDRAAELVAEAEYVLTPELVISFCRDIENFGNAKPNELKAAHPEVPSSVWVNGWPGFSICNTRTVSTSVFVMDNDYPGLLSTMWMSIYNPCYCTFVPMHNAMLKGVDLANSELEMYTDGSAWRTAAKLRDSNCYDWGEIVPELEAWESDAMTANSEAEDLAIALIEAGMVEEAAELLTESDIGLALDAIDFLISLSTCACDVFAVAWNEAIAKTQK